MKDELDKQLCEKYPKLFSQRNMPMNQTCMCWGFECDDGWFNILDQLGSNIQWHIDQSRKQRNSALRYNRALKQALAGNTTALTKHYTYGDSVNAQTAKYVNADIAKPAYRTVGEACPQVTVKQVKEKFGTLRFYYSGGDDRIDGMVSMADAMSGVTCETCGAPGSRRGGGWIRTLCDKHAEEQGIHLSKEEEDELGL